MTQLFLSRAETAMYWARKAKRHPEKQGHKIKKAIQLMVMVCGIYWVEEVRREKRRK